MTKIGLKIGVVVAAGAAWCNAAGAAVVLSNLNGSVVGVTVASYIGQAFSAGPGGSVINSVSIRTGVAPTTPLFEIETRNGDGTVGATVNSAFVYSYNSATGLATFTPSTVFTLAANAGYFMVLSDPGKGSGNQWGFTATSPSTATNGFTIPATDTSFGSATDNLVSGPASFYDAGPFAQYFSLSATAAIPEPATAMAVPVVLALGRRGRRRESAAGGAVPC